MPIRLLTDLYSGLMDLVYPPFCLVCEAAGPDYLCAKCIERIDVIDPPYCRKCGLPCETSVCHDCREHEFVFECARSVGTFDGALRQAIHALKYKRYVVIADPLGELMARHFPSTHLAGQIDVVVPIPIHRSRLIERGFNQAEELSRKFCRRCRLALEPDALEKPEETRHQVDLPKDKRAQNLRDAFKVKSAYKIRGKRVLLVDDVFTTGSTLDEAAKILMNAGAKSVCAYTLARSV